MAESLHERARRMSERSLIRAWEYRQRNYSKGVWYRLRRILVDAAEAWIIEENDADRLESEGFVPLPVGREMAPPKRLFFMTEERLKKVAQRRQVPVRLCAELLQAANLGFIPHSNAQPKTRAASPA
jgi:hypothetical protein